VRRDDPPPQFSRFDYTERRQSLDAEFLRELWMTVDRDTDHIEGVVVAAALQDLGDEPVHPATAPGSRGVEEDELRPLLRRWLWEKCHG
jgi:hypothetical protein